MEALAYVLYLGILLCASFHVHDFLKSRNVPMIERLAVLLTLGLIAVFVQHYL